MNTPSLYVRFMTKMTQWLRATCQDTSSIISESLDHPLPLSKWWRLKFHLALCVVCRYYLDQLKTLQNLARRLGKEDNNLKDQAGLRPEFKEKLKQSVRSSKPGLS